MKLICLFEFDSPVVHTKAYYTTDNTQKSLDSQWNQ